MLLDLAVRKARTDQLPTTILSLTVFDLPHRIFLVTFPLCFLKWIAHKLNNPLFSVWPSPPPPHSHLLIKPIIRQIHTRRQSATAKKKTGGISNSGTKKKESAKERGFLPTRMLMHYALSLPLSFSPLWSPNVSVAEQIQIALATTTSRNRHSNAQMLNI